SSQSVYGEGAGLTEADFDPLNHRFATPADRNADYGEAKRQAEAVLFQENAFPVTAVRFPIVLGDDDYTERLKFHVDRVRNGKPVFFPNLDAKLSFVDSADAAGFLHFLAGHGPLGPVNCCSPEPISLRSLISAIEGALGAEAVTTDRAN